MMAYARVLSHIAAHEIIVVMYHHDIIYDIMNFAKSPRPPHAVWNRDDLTPRDRTSE